ncbi:MAG: hypothetical protein EBR30_15310 [Cytophagia bacterium]|nr:hypothetical protein [Cytophagia bacterium]
MSSELKIGVWITFIPECDGKQMELFAPRKKGKITDIKPNGKIVVDVNGQSCNGDLNNAILDKNGVIKDIIDDLI